MEMNELLAKREQTHGSFDKNAAVSQGLKDMMRQYRYQLGGDFTQVHSEVMDMIALKLARILSGQADYAEHWLDIAGYAKLAADRCSK